MIRVVTVLLRDVWVGGGMLGRWCVWGGLGGWGWWWGGGVRGYCTDVQCVCVCVCVFVCACKCTGVFVCVHHCMRGYVRSQVFFHLLSNHRVDCLLTCCNVGCVFTTGRGFHCERCQIE